MVWREVSVEDQRREFVMLASCEGANVAELCRRFGISRQTGYRWRARFAAGDASFGDRSRRPHHSPGRLPAELEARILTLRDTHPAWGARKLAALIRRDGIVPPAVSSVHQVLLRHGRIAADAAGRAHCRFEHERPNALWQMDFKGCVRLADGSWLHPLTVIDDHSRYAVVLAACSDERTATVREHLERALRRHGLPDALLSRQRLALGRRRARAMDAAAGVAGKTRRRPDPQPPLSPARPRQERALPPQPQGRSAGPANLPQPCPCPGRLRCLAPPLQHRAPASGARLRRPAERYRPAHRAFPKILAPMVYAEGEVLRRVGTTKNYVSFRNRLWRVPDAFAGEILAIRPRRPEGRYVICFGAHEIAAIDLTKPTPQHPA